jgi:hypothetical protein
MKKMKTQSTTSFLVQPVVLLKKIEISSAKKFQKINVEYADSKTSPLTKEDLASFKTFDLSYK